MSAQKELVELNATTGHWSDETERKAAHWVEKHGPAIAELIEAVAARRNAESAWFYYECTDQVPGRYDPNEGLRLETLRDESIERETKALRKLTEPKV